MISPSLRRQALACAGTWLVAGAIAAPPGLRLVRADEVAPPPVNGGPHVRGLHTMPPAEHAGQRAVGTFTSSTGWWLGMSGIALALAVFGGVSLASRRFLPGRGTGPLQVVGRTSLSPKHTVYLLRAGDRVLIVGTGSQGAPSLLGEWTGPMDRWLSSQQANVSAPGFEPSNGDEP